MWEIWANELFPKALKSCPSPINRQIWSHCLWRRRMGYMPAKWVKRRNSSVIQQLTRHSVLFHSLLLSALRASILWVFHCFLKNGHVLFSSFPHYTIELIDESIVGVLGSQTRGGRMKDTDKSIELWHRSFSLFIDSLTFSRLLSI